MKMFTIESKKTILRGAAAFCAASFLTACAPAAVIETTPEASAPSMSASEASLSQETSAPWQTAADTSESAPEQTYAPTVEIPDETISLSELMEESSIQLKSQDGEIGDYSFFACNETQVFGDYSIAWATYQNEDYLMLSYNGVALLAKEDGSDARLFYDGTRLDLPFPCYFNLEYKYLSLHEGDFTGSGARQLALVIPVETGSGINIEELRVIDLDAMSLVPLDTDREDYEESIYALFEGHFAETGMTREYYLFDYVEYSISGNQISVRYGACNEDDIYLSFLEGELSAQPGGLFLGPDVRFTDEEL